MTWDSLHAAPKSTRASPVNSCDLQANFSLIKHFEPDHFAMPLGISAVALMWRANHEGNFGIDNHLGAPQALWHTISYIAAVGLGIQLILLVSRPASLD